MAKLVLEPDAAASWVVWLDESKPCVLFGTIKAIDHTLTTSVAVGAHSVQADKLDIAWANQQLGFAGGGITLIGDIDTLNARRTALETALRGTGRAYSSTSQAVTTPIYYFYVGYDTEELNVKVRTALATNSRGKLIPAKKGAFHTSRSIRSVRDEPRELFSKPLGVETQSFKNTGTTPMDHKIKVEQTFTKRVFWQTERATTVGAGVTVAPLPWLTGSLSAQQMVRDTYGETTERSETFTEETSVVIAPKSTRKVNVRWTEIWRRGVVYVTEAEMPIVTEHPYEVFVRLKYDIE